MRAIQAGKPVFVEKPLVINQQQLDQIIACVGIPSAPLPSPGGEGQGEGDSNHNDKSQIQCPSGRSLKSVMVGFNRRFAPATALAESHFASVTTPKQILIRVNAGAIPADHWIHDPFVGGGRLIGEGCHFIDLAVALTGSLIERVSATATPKAGLPPASWDDFSISLTMADGSIATIAYTSVGDAHLPKERIEISGGGRSAVIDDFRNVELWSRGRRTRHRSWAQDKGQRAEMNAWIEGVSGGGCPIPLEQIFNVHRACFAAISSIQDGNSVRIV
jgi:polar amino acid transport system substrate-binding protein